MFELKCKFSGQALCAVVGRSDSVSTGYGPRPTFVVVTAIMGVQSKPLRTREEYENWLSTVGALLKKKGCYRAIAEIVAELQSRENVYSAGSSTASEGEEEEGADSTSDPKFATPGPAVAKAKKAKKKPTLKRDLLDKAFGIIWGTLDESLYPVVRHCTEPAELIKEIYDHFFLESGSNMVTLCIKLWELKLYESEPASTLFDQINTITNGIRAQGGNIGDVEKAAVALKALPSSYAGLRTQLDAQLAVARRKDKRAQLSYNDIKNAVLLYETSIEDGPHASKVQGDTAYMTQVAHQYRNKDCHRCGVKGHVAAVCMAPAPVQRGGAAPPKTRPFTPCYVCGEPGHWKRECPKRQEGAMTAFDYFESQPY